MASAIASCSSRFSTSGTTPLHSRTCLFSSCSHSPRRLQLCCRAVTAEAPVEGVFASLGEWAPLAELGALAGAAIGIYFFLKILLWDYQERGTDYDRDVDNSDQIVTPLGSIFVPKAIMVQGVSPSYRPRVRDPRLQTLAREATLEVLLAIGEVRALWQTQLIMHALQSNGVLWHWVRLWLAEHARTDQIYFGSTSQSMGFDAITAQLCRQGAAAQAVKQVQGLSQELENLDERFHMVTFSL
ncbi:hypothetical protein WJX72_006848 [[Myrmecia] bisecta]|uniref:Uncharacterized protein n=1 Tax=[Myrmecia] bisecta TaxID=41462 RepID=A0AAW1PH26_9CHLO